MNRNEFIVLTSYLSGNIRYININHISCYYLESKTDCKTRIELLSGSWLWVRETCEQIKEKIDEVTSK